MNVSVKAKESIKINLVDSLKTHVLEYEMPLIYKKQIKTKNMNKCSGSPFKPGNQVCIYFHKISSICLIVGKDGQDWTVKGNCGVAWK